MELELTEDQELYHAAAVQFLDACAPMDRVRAGFGDRRGAEPDFWRQAGDLGWTGLFVPEAWDGGSLAGTPLLDVVLVAEELGRRAAPGPLLPVSLVAAALARAGSEAQQEVVLPLLARGEAVAAWCGVGPALGASVAARRSVGGWVLSGRVARVEAAETATFLVVVAQAPEGLTQFVVSADAPGVTVTPLDSLDLVRPLGDVMFEDVVVDSEALLGAPGAAAADVEHLLGLAVAIQCADTAGVLGRVFEMTLAYAFDRFSFGRPLASYQALKHRFADHKVVVEACLAAATGVARAVQADAPDVAFVVAAAKSYIGGHATDVVQDCVQLHGGIGVTWDHDLHVFLRRVTVNRVLHGTPEEHREHLAELLGLGVAP